MIADTKLCGFGGGSIDERKYYDAFRTYAQENNDIFRVICLDEGVEDKFPVQVKKTRFMDLGARFLGHSTYICFVWKAIRDEVFAYSPDVIVLGRSRMGFIARDVKQKLPMCKVICNMANIEHDYVDGYFANALKLIKPLCIKWEKNCVFRDESMMIRYADALNFLTERDQLRAQQFYGAKQSVQCIVPVCIERPVRLCRISSVKNVVFVGSLHYDANIQAITTFINEVWRPSYEQREDVHLIVGGSTPSKKLLSFLNSVRNISIYCNYSALEDIIPQGSLMIAPIQAGAGMKVKVAETLSMGLMIAASDEALVGYDDAIKADVHGGIMCANTPEEYRKAIDKYCALNAKELEAFSLNQMELYKHFYSYSVSRAKVRSVLEQFNA